MSDADAAEPADGAAGDPADPRPDGGADPADGAAGDPADPRPDGGADPADFEYRTTVIPRTSVRVVMPIVLLTAVSLLLQGHNLPGGGFIGGVLTVTAFVLVYVVFGMEYLQSHVLAVPTESGPGHRLVGAYRRLFALGLALAAGSGLVPVLLGFPFLTQAVAILEGVPLYGEFELASALAFDLGVYLVVVGALLTVVAEVGSE